MTLDADGAVTASRHGDHLLGKRLVLVGGVAVGSGAERAAALRSVLLARGVGESVDLTFVTDPPLDD